MPATPTQIATELFERIIAENPRLTMYPVRESGYHDAEMNIPAQDGLKFPVHLVLKNHDQLHLVVDPFWGEWRPCTDPDEVKAYLKAVNGLLSGEYRIEIVSRSGKAVKGILEAPRRRGWKTVAEWNRLHLPLGKKTMIHIRNR